ncbi:hypothetical protein B0H13DRAFT_1875239 [Mycena leptocephala]|nr:hypothetical protein B0H13DRAFT_1875239 [Mycena leptocephala]
MARGKKSRFTLRDAIGKYRQLPALSGNSSAHLSAPARPASVNRTAGLIRTYFAPADSNTGQRKTNMYCGKGLYTYLLREGSLPGGVMAVYKSRNLDETVRSALPMRIYLFNRRLGSSRLPLKYLTARLIPVLILSLLFWGNTDVELLLCLPDMSFYSRHSGETGNGPVHSYSTHFGMSPKQMNRGIVEPACSDDVSKYEAMLSIRSGKDLRTEASRATPSRTFTQARSTDVSRKVRPADLPPNTQPPETFLNRLNCKCWSLEFGIQERNKWNEALEIKTGHKT